MESILEPDLILYEFEKDLKNLRYRDKVIDWKINERYYQRNIEFFLKNSNQIEEIKESIRKRASAKSGPSSLQNELIDEDRFGPLNRESLDLNKFGFEFETNVFVIDEKSPSELVEKLIRSLNDERMIGIDTESVNKMVCLLQIATSKHIWLIDCLNPPKGPMKIEGSKISILVHNSKDSSDVTTFKRMFGIEGKVNVIDIVGVYLSAENKSRKDKNNLAFLVEFYLKLKLEKNLQQSNWTLRPLSKFEIHYAACDAYVLLMIYKKQIESE